jgi:hypothetical protein
MLQTKFDDKWFDEKVAPDDEQDEGCHPDEVKALKDYYYKKTTAKEAARAIIQPVENSKEPIEDLPRLWGLLIDALLEMPRTEIPAVLQLLDAIQQCPEPDLTRWPTKPWGDNLVWRQLYHFGHDWSDFVRRSDSCRVSPDCDPVDRADKQALHIRGAEIAARLIMSDVGGLPLDWGYDCCADALESSQALLDFDVPAAAGWIVIAGERMRKAAAEGYESIHLERSRDLGWNSKVMSLERWSFWEKRMREMMTSQDSPVTRDAAKAAVDRMEALRQDSHDS